MATTSSAPIGPGSHSSPRRTCHSRGPLLRSPNGHSARSGTCKPVGERTEEGNDLVLFFLGQAEVADGLVQVCGDLGGRPTRDSLRTRGATGGGKSIARVIEVDHFLQALQVAIVHVGFD